MLFSEEKLHFSYNTVCIMPLHHISKHDLLLVNYCAATAKKDKNNKAVAEQYTSVAQVRQNNSLRRNEQ